MAKYDKKARMGKVIKTTQGAEKAKTVEWLILFKKLKWSKWSKWLFSPKTPKWPKCAKWAKWVK